MRKECVLCPMGESLADLEGVLESGHRLEPHLGKKHFPAEIFPLSLDLTFCRHHSRTRRGRALREDAKIIGEFFARAPGGVQRGLHEPDPLEFPCAHRYGTRLKASASPNVKALSYFLSSAVEFRSLISRVIMKSSIVRRLSFSSLL